MTGSEGLCRQRLQDALLSENRGPAEPHWGADSWQRFVWWDGPLVHLRVCVRSFLQAVCNLRREASSSQRGPMQASGLSRKSWGRGWGSSPSTRCALRGWSLVDSGSDLPDKRPSQSWPPQILWRPEIPICLSWAISWPL